MAGGTAQELRERVSHLEELVGTSQEDGGMAGRVEQHAEDLVEMRQGMEDFMAAVNERLDSLDAKVTTTVDLLMVIDLLRTQVQKLEDEFGLVKRALRSPPPPSPTSFTAASIKVPEPKAFFGERNSKELENFLWDMEQYFRAAKIPEEEQVSITSMYLAGDAKLWWRTRQQDDAGAGRPPIATWEMLKKELSDQFLPCNAAWLAREKLRSLKHSGTVREYVKEFSSLMLDIKNMSDEDKLFNFMAGLQPWAQKELRRHAVKNLPTAIAVADGLADFNTIASSGEKKKSDFGAKKKKDVEDSRQTIMEQQKNQFACFNCKGPHRVRDCPKTAKLNALVVEKKLDEEASRDDYARVNCIRLMEPSARLEEKLTRTSSSSSGGGLLHP